MAAHAARCSGAENAQLSFSGRGRLRLWRHQSTHSKRQPRDAGAASGTLSAVLAVKAGEYRNIRPRRQKRHELLAATTGEPCITLYAHQRCGSGTRPGGTHVAHRGEHGGVAEKAPGLRKHSLSAFLWKGLWCLVARGFCRSAPRHAERAYILLSPNSYLPLCDGAPAADVKKRQRRVSGRAGLPAAHRPSTPSFSRPPSFYLFASRVSRASDR